jgi:hypothetical protein
MVEHERSTSAELRPLILALEDIGKSTQEMHRQNEGRLIALMQKVDRHNEIIQQYLIKQDSWEKIQADFTGPTSFHVQLSMVRGDIAHLRSQITDLKQEWEVKIDELLEQQHKDRQLEVQRRLEHENNQTRIKTAYIGALIAAATSLAVTLLELLKR